MRFVSTKGIINILPKTDGPFLVCLITSNYFVHHGSPYVSLQKKSVYYPIKGDGHPHINRGECINGGMNILCIPCTMERRGVDFAWQIMF